MFIKTEGIVLRETEINDADKLLDILSRDRGLLTVKARGVRRGSSPLKSACQLLALSEFTLQEYKGRLTVQVKPSALLGDSFCTLANPESRNRLCLRFCSSYF